MMLVHALQSLIRIVTDLSYVYMYVCRYLFNYDRELCDILLTSSVINAMRFKHLGLVKMIDGYSFGSIHFRTIAIRLLVSVIISLTTIISVKALLRAITSKLYHLHILRSHPAELVDSRGRQVPTHKLYCIDVPTR